MGKKKVCCFKVSRSSSCSSSSSEYCPTVTTGGLVTLSTYEVAEGGVGDTAPLSQYRPFGAINTVADAFVVSGQLVESAYITPLVCDKGTAVFNASFGYVYLVEKAPSVCTHPYLVVNPIPLFAETTGNSADTFTTGLPGSSVKLCHNQALAFVPLLPVVVGTDALERVIVSSDFIYTFYPKCSPVPCPNVTTSF